MPYSSVDPGSGAIIFHQTDTEKAVDEVVKENEELKARLDKLEALLMNSNNASNTKSKK